MFKVVKSCEKFLEVDFHFVKVERAENNSAIYLAIKFLNTYINNLDEDSPQYFKIIELNSGIGLYQGKQTFTFDMIDKHHLRNHLKEIIPSIICFYSLENTIYTAFTCPIILGVCINEINLFHHYEKFNTDKNYINGRKHDIKNIAMKLALDLIYECLGHIKVQFNPEIYHSPLIRNLKKCFDSKMSKEIMRYKCPIKKNKISILIENNKSDTNNYLEDALGKLQGTKINTSICLRTIKNNGNLLDHPELFYKKENLLKLQKYAYYKLFYEKKRKNEEINNEFNFEHELEFLSDFYNKNKENEEEIKEENKEDKKELEIKEEVKFEKDKINKKKKRIKRLKSLSIYSKPKKLLKHKTKRPHIKKSELTEEDINGLIEDDIIDDIIEPENKKKKIKSHRRLNDIEILDILINNDLSISQIHYYLRMLHENSIKA